MMNGSSTSKDWSARSKRREKDDHADENTREEDASIGWCGYCRCDAIAALVELRDCAAVSYHHRVLSTMGSRAAEDVPNPEELLGAA